MYKNKHGTKCCRRSLLCRRLILSATLATWPLLHWKAQTDMPLLLIYRELQKCLMLRFAEHTPEVLCPICTPHFQNFPTSSGFSSPNSAVPFQAGGYSRAMLFSSWSHIKYNGLQAWPVLHTWENQNSFSVLLSLCNNLRKRLPSVELHDKCGKIMLRKINRNIKTNISFGILLLIYTVCSHIQINACSCILKHTCAVTGKVNLYFCRHIFLHRLITRLS